MTRAVVTYDTMSSTSLGTGTTKLQINAASDYFFQGEMNVIHDIGGWHASTGATTAAQTYKPVIFLESQDVNPNVAPIHYPMEGQAGGLGTTTAGVIPGLEMIPVNIKATASNRFQGYGQYLTANTVAGRLGLTMKQSNQSTKLRRAFYEVAGSPTGTAAGTAATSVNGSNITITSAEKALLAFGRFYPTTVTASEDYIGNVFMTSDNWESENLRFAYQPIGSALGALITVGNFSSPSMRTMAIERWFKGNGQGQYLIANGVTIAEALTGDGTFINGVCFVRPTM